MGHYQIYLLNDMILAIPVKGITAHRGLEFSS